MFSRAQPSRTVKVLVLGDAGAGKTTFVRALQRAADPRAAEPREPEKKGGCEITCIRYDLGDDEVLVQLWDISGAKSHATTRTAFYRDFNAVVCVFDANNVQSFHNLVVWLFELCYFGAAPPSRMLFPVDCDEETGDTNLSSCLLRPDSALLVVANKEGPRPEPQAPAVRPSLLERLLGTQVLEMWRPAAETEAGQAMLARTVAFLATAPVVPLHRIDAHWTTFLRRAKFRAAQDLSP